MPNTISKEEYKKFLKEHPISEEMFETIKDRYGIKGVDLDVEKKLVEMKKSNLSRSKREAVLELSKIKDLIKEINDEEKNKEKIEEIGTFSTN